MSGNNIKEILFKQCKAFVDGKLATIEKTIKSNQNALASETKSSAGDKHETGRAMLQLEMEKTGQQLKEVHTMQEILARVNLNEFSELIRLGSIVKTNSAVYFIAISAGKILFEDKEYYAISSSSPIGKMLLGRRTDEKISFNGKEILIKKVL